jgi:heme exporter protein D
VSHFISISLSLLYLQFQWLVCSYGLCPSGQVDLGTYTFYIVAQSGISVLSVMMAWRFTLWRLKIMKMVFRNSDHTVHRTHYSSITKISDESCRPIEK